MSEVDTDSLYLEGRTLEKEGKKEEALRKFEEVVSADEKFDKAWFYKFKIHYELGQIEEATKCAQKAVDLNFKYVKFIRAVEKKTNEQREIKYREIRLNIPAKNITSQQRPRTIRRKAPMNSTSNWLNVDPLTLSLIGMQTSNIDGKGPHSIIDPDSKEEWVIEKKGDQIILHSYKAPKRSSEYSYDDVSKSLRLLKALGKTMPKRTRQYTDVL